MTHDVIIVGAGITGLYAAQILNTAGRNTLVVDRDLTVGGRLQTDQDDTFLLDRGLQVLLPAYEEASKAFDYPELDLRYFNRGVRIYLEGKWKNLLDPSDAPWKAMLSIFSKIGNLKDKMGIVHLQTRSLKGTLKGDESKTTREYLKGAGFSDQVIHRFFKPLFGGLFLETALATNSSEFANYVSMLSREGGAIPARGISSLPNQLRDSLPDEIFQLGKEVSAVQTGKITLRDGSTLEAKDIILAIDAESLSSLIPDSIPEQATKKLGTTCIYFTGPPNVALPPVLHLIPDSKNGITNIAPLSSVAREYATSGQALFSVNITHSAENTGENIEGRVKEELIDLFGKKFEKIRALKTYIISETVYCGEAKKSELTLPEGVYFAGEFFQRRNINRALIAGREAAEKILLTSSLPNL